MTGQTFTASAVGSTLVGTSGDDTFNASQAADTLTGGAGADVFHFATKPWEPTHITDFQVGIDKLDLSELLTAVGYAGSDPIADQYVRFMDNGAGGTKVLFDRDGAATGQLWPDRILELDSLAYNPANAGQMLTGVASGGVPAPPPPLPTSGGASGQVFTAAGVRSTLAGTSGADTFNGSAAGDTLTGGAGADVFHFATKPWEPTHITDFQVGVDKLDLSDLLKAVGYAGSDPIADQYIQFMDNGAGGTKVLFDRDGAAAGQLWPDRILELDKLAYSPANAGQMMLGANGGGATTPPSTGGSTGGGSTGGGGSQVFTASDVRSVLVGTSGADTFNASQAGDTITGGAGADLFHFATKPWEPAHITDFQVGVDKLDLSDLLKAVGYAGSDPVGDHYIQFMDNGAGGTKVLFDRDGAATGQQWPDRIIELDNVAYNPANAGQMLAGSTPTSGGNTTNPPPGGGTVGATGGGSPAPNGAFVLFAGQSNTGGNYLTASQVDAAWKPDPLTQIWNQQTHAWEQLVPGQNTGWSNGALANSWGPEVEYAIKFRAAYPTEKLYILKQADGGTTLANDWDPDISGRLFDNVTHLVQEAGAALGGRRPEMLFWGQGETDGNTLASAQAYGANLTEFVTAARSQWLGDVNGKIALFRIDTSPPYATYVRQGQLAVDQADPNVVSFDTVSFPVQSDNLHFAAAGIDMVGAADFDAYAAWRSVPRVGVATPWLYKDEGQSGATAFSYVLTRTGDTSAPLSVNWAVSGSGAHPANGADFVGGSLPGGTVTFAAGETSKTIVFNAAGDTAVEPSEHFTVTLTGAGSALIGAASAEGVIVDDDTLNRASGAVVTASGMNSVLNGGAGADTLVASQGGDTLTGGAGADVFVVKAGPITPLTVTDFTPGTDKIDISALLPPSYHGDAVADLYVVLRASASGGALVYVDPDGGLQTGQNFQFIGELQGVSPWVLKGSDFITGVSGANGGAPQLSFATTSATHLEGGSGPVTFAYLVTRTGDTGSVATAHWSVSGAGADPANAYDFAGGILPSGDITFGVGETSKIISLSVAGDSAVERDESFVVTLSNASGAGLGAASASGLIVNDDIDPNASRVLTAANPHSVLAGGGGNDTLNASAAGDTLTGGGGSDLFVFATKPWEPTHITDFQVGVDRIDVSAILHSFGYAGTNPLADHYVQLADDGAGGTKILFDRDGVASGQQWPDYAINLDRTPLSVTSTSSGWLLT